MPPATASTVLTVRFVCLSDLCPTNAEAEEINTLMINQFPGELVEFKSIDTTEDNSTEYTPEFLNTCSLPGLAPHSLNLKLGAPVVLLRNMDARNGHCNGVKYVDLMWLS